MKNVTCCAAIALFLSFGGAAALAEDDLAIRIGIAESVKVATVTVSKMSPIKVETPLGWQTLATLSPSVPLKLEMVGGQVRVSGPIPPQTFKRVQLMPEDQETLVSAQGKWYRGGLDVYPATTQSLAVVNEVPLEKYLFGVIPSEMPASWPIEALKSQAVAARTYTISHLGAHRKKGYDLVATTSSQVYQGVKGETFQSNQAVSTTAGEILTHNNKPIHAYYHSTSGGQTEAGSSLWAPFAYLQSVADYDHDSPKFTWYSEFSQPEMKTALAKMGIQVGDVLALQTSQRSVGGRVKTLRIVGTQGTKQLDGAKMRTALGLNSTFFNVGSISPQGDLQDAPDSQNIPRSFQIAGRGWGHGLGMSQWGARGMAMRGHNYRDILGHYYRGASLERLNKSAMRLAQTP